MTRVITALLLGAIVAAPPASAQEREEAEARRPATATYWGDTGLWFVPTAEILRSSSWAFSLYRTEFDFTQGSTDVSDWPLTAAVGIGSRTEVFGALRVVTRIDRDGSPLFSSTNQLRGGLVNDYPFVRDTWTGNKLGDLYLGAKVNLMSESRRQPIALAVRGTVKIPTADEDVGAGTGEYDAFADVIISREIGRVLELSGYGGAVARGDHPEFRIADAARWGGGAAIGARANLRLTAEAYGEIPFQRYVTTPPGLVVGADGSSPPLRSEINNIVGVALGLTWQHSSGLALGAGVSYQFEVDNGDVTLLRSEDASSDKIGIQFRLGFHRGVGIFRPPAPPRLAEAPPTPQPAPEPVPAPAPPPPPPANRQPVMLRAQCDPCRVEAGQTIALRAESTDPDGDPLTYRWSVPAGTIGDTRTAATKWTASTVPGPVTFTVTSDDGRGGTASAAVTVEVVRAALTDAAFEDVHFDLNSAVLRPDAMVALERTVTLLREHPEAQIVIEGHACDMGPESYNQDLGDRRARAVLAYLSSQGIDASRLLAISYGESRPKYDNSSEETRRLNRRVAFVADDEAR